jgi:hypothetical protein
MTSYGNTKSNNNCVVKNRIVNGCRLASLIAANTVNVLPLSGLSVTIRPIRTMQTYGREPLIACTRIEAIRNVNRAHP